MYCRNCAYQMDELAVVCVQCGSQNGNGQNFCQNCAHPSPPGAVHCQNCGVGLRPVIVGEQKSKIAAGVLGILVGYFGVHNFYLGNTGKAIAQLLITVVSCGVLSPVSAIWGLVEGIMILTGSINVDANGVPLKD